MHEGPSVTWREVAEKHHASFIDEMKTVYDASIRAAVSDAVEEVRKEAQVKLSEAQSNFEQRFESSLQQAREEAEKALAEQSANAERTRQAELSRLQTEAQQTLAEVKAGFERAREVEREKARKEVKQTFAEQWNQVFRRLRLCQTEEAVLAFLTDASTPYAETLVVVSFANNLVRVANSRNTSAPGSHDFPVNEAPAVLAVVESRDPVVALAVENEISPVLMRMLKPAIGEKAYLFPVRGRQAVVAVVVAHGQVAPGAIELLCEASGFQFDLVASQVSGTVPAVQGQSSAGAQKAQATSSFAARDTAEDRAAGARGVKEERPIRVAEANVADDNPEKAALVQIRGVQPGTGTFRGNGTEETAGLAVLSERKAWEELDPAEQKLHLQAQRFARVQVAEMRLYKPEAVRQGLADKNLYQPLKSEMDEARKQFLHRFLSISPSMVDYLHLEILRSLAHDDDRLLGHDYPGPMV